MAVRRSFSAVTLTRLREMPAGDALALVAIHIKADPTYRPLKTDHSKRWHVRTACGEFEILTTGPKWYDTRSQSGGGGAIDLAMHVLGLSFVDAVKRLTAR
jgi:hypothetical protein